MVLNRSSIRYLFTGLVLLSLLSLAEIGYYQLKATLAQVLLESAWKSSQKTPALDIKPWPWADTWPVFKLSLLKNTEQKSPLNGVLINTATESGYRNLQQIGEYIVLADASGESLAFGPGLMTSGVWPGAMGNSLLAGHRDTHFSSLAKLMKNDEIQIELKDGTIHRFLVDIVKVVDSRHEQPVVVQNETRLTLVTCYPFDMDVQQTPLRLLVSGQKIKLI